jgi:hypothetical protein
MMHPASDCSAPGAVHELAVTIGATRRGVQAVGLLG